MAKKNKTNANANEQAKAIAEFKEYQKNAQKQLNEFADVHDFEIKSECLDKQGEKTKVLYIDTDKKGYIGKFLLLGNPISFDAETGKTSEDGAKIAEYLQFMASIDIEENAEAIGMQAIAKARNVVTDFFTLVLVSALNVGEEMASSHFPKWQT